MLLNTKCFIELKIQQYSSILNVIKTFNFSKINHTSHYIHAHNSIGFVLLKQERLRAKACEDLEAESIRANVLRHRLRALPTDVEGEFAAAVHAARQLNHDKIEALKSQLAAVTSSIEAAEARMAEIRFESSVLWYFLYFISTIACAFQFLRLFMYKLL